MVSRGLSITKQIKGGQQIMADKKGKTLAQFNAKNGVYSVDGTAVSPLTYMTGFSKEPNLDTKSMYGDGELQTTLVSDKGFSGTLGVTARDLEYETALGMVKAIDGGNAEVQLLAVKEHSFGFETQMLAADGTTKVKKVWVFGVEAQRPSDALTQNTESVNESTYEYPIIIKGTRLKDSAGTANYVDPTSGSEVQCYTYSKVPTDTGYDTFLDSVPVPKAKAVA